MCRKALLALYFLASAGPSPLAAQSPAEREVQAVIDRLFDAMRRGDSAAARAVFHPEARLQTASARPDGTTLRTASVDDFVRAVGSPRGEVWDERISDVVIFIDDPLATAWMRYAFYLGERLSHCGVNAFHLVRTGQGWKVTQVTDTRRAECGPPGGSAEPGG
jgi:hypothetical protein